MRLTHSPPDRDAERRFVYASVVLTTKVGRPIGDDVGGAANRAPPGRAPQGSGSRALDDSLFQVLTDQVDLFQIHRPVPDKDLEETLFPLTNLPEPEPTGGEWAT